MPERESLVTFLLKPLDGGTELTLTHKHLPDEEARVSYELELWRSGTIGDEAYRIAEEELDWIELSSQPVVRDGARGASAALG